MYPATAELPKYTRWMQPVDGAVFGNETGTISNTEPKEPGMKGAWPWVHDSTGAELILGRHLPAVFRAVAAPGDRAL